MARMHCVFPRLSSDPIGSFPISYLYPTFFIFVFNIWSHSLFILFQVAVWCLCKRGLKTVKAGPMLPSMASCLSRRVDSTSALHCTHKRLYSSHRIVTFSKLCETFDAHSIHPTVYLPFVDPCQGHRGSPTARFQHQSDCARSMLQPVQTDQGSKVDKLPVL